MVTFLKVFPQKLMRFLQSKKKVYRNRKRKIWCKNYIKLGYKAKAWNMMQHEIKKKPKTYSS